MEAAALIRTARTAAGLSQADLARRAGTTQAAIARVEGGGVSPTGRTLERLLAVAGRRLELTAAPAASGIDETLIARQLRLSPAERLRAFETSYEDARRLAGAARRPRAGVA